MGNFDRLLFALRCVVLSRTRRFTNGHRRLPRGVLLVEAKHSGRCGCDELVGLWLPDRWYGRPPNPRGQQYLEQ
jgi:hypothetical protein